MASRFRVILPAVAALTLVVVMIRTRVGVADPVLQAAADAIRPLHPKKSPPGPNDWLATHRESGQTFEEYRGSNSNRPTDERTTLYIQPLGEFSRTHERLIT